MAGRHTKLTPGLRRALNAWFAEHPEHLHEMAPFRRVIEEREQHAMNDAMLQAKREYLSLLLESKFGPLSKELISRLGTLYDIDELTRLYKRALQVQTLEEIGIR